MADDKVLNCVECGLAFVFSGEEANRHAQRGYSHEPRRCPPCRADARRRRAQETPPPPRRAGPGHVTLCSGCGVEVFLPAPPAPGTPAFCDACASKS